MAQDHKGGDRDGHLDYDRADRQEPDFALGLPIHVFPVSGPTGLLADHLLRNSIFQERIQGFA